MSTNVGIVGLGKMGLPVAISLLEHGFAVSGYRRHMSADFISRGGTPLTSSKEVAQHSDIVLTCLPTDRALLEVVEGEQGLVHGAHPGLVVVEISMLSLQAKEQARTNLQRAHVPMLDCPISGTPAQVVPRKTVFFGSGDEEVFQHCLPVLQAITDHTFYLGSFGAGSKMKCVANLLVAVHMLAAAEAMVLSIKAGLDPEMVMKVINPSIAGSTMLAARGPMMAGRRYEPPLGSIHQVQEFIPLIKALAEESCCPTPLLDLAAGYYDRAAEEGRGEQDIAAMFSVLGKEAGIE
jgi:putative dehydrogenase